MPINPLPGLAAVLEGELLHDDASRMLYATDASIYQQRPMAVAFPKSTTDCVRLVEFANQHAMAIIPRAAGTSLAGQVVGPHLVVDTSRYLNHILHIDYQQRTARVQPGVIPAQLNEQLRAQGLMFAPDPSTLNRCTIGGMIGNNAWGAHCPRHGTTREHIVALTAILSDTTAMHCQALDHAQLTQKQALANSEGAVYRCVTDTITRQRDVILAQYPDPALVPCNAGYALHVLAGMQPWQAEGVPFNLAALLCGSEGTLAFTTEATVKLTPLPRHSLMLCPHFDTLAQALHAVTLAKSFQPAAIELLDQYLLRLTRHNLQQQRNRGWIRDDPAAVLLIEFCGDDENSLKDSAKQLGARLQQEKLAQHIPLLQGPDTGKAWNIRRASLGLLMGVTGRRKPVTFIEDSAVPVSALAEFVSEAQQLMAQHATECVYYGSVSMGLIHLRPLLDLKDPDDVALLRTLAQAVAALLRRHHGTLSAKHGDGIVRGRFVRELLGDAVDGMLADIKHSFDPKGILNPGKIVDPLPMDQHLRLTAFSGQQAPATFFQWRNDGGFFRTVEKCNGAGACRKTSSALSAANGTMCPSYMATHNELDSTRGRANIFRQLMQQFGFDQGIMHPALHSALRNCLACKACQSECPANVDMAKMKAEYHYQCLKHRGKNRRQYLVQQLATVNRIAALWPALANRLLQAGITKSLLGIASQRQLPRFARFTLTQWYAQHDPRRSPQQAEGTQPEVVLLCDPFSQYYDVDAGIAAIEFLERIGYRVTLSPCFASLRGLISQGLLQQAQRVLQDMLAWLAPYAGRAVPIIGLEPSELLTLRDEATDFPLASPYVGQVQDVAQQSLLFDEFIAQQAQRINAMALPWQSGSKQVYVHGHCHQKSLSGMQPTLDALAVIPHVVINEIPSGCCGMAGLFGYEPEHYALSLQIAELVLFPTLRHADTDAVIVATGTSCRQQILHGLQRQAVHSAQLLRSSLVSP